MSGAESAGGEAIRLAWVSTEDDHVRAVRLHLQHYRNQGGLHRGNGWKLVILLPLIALVLLGYRAL